MPQQFVQILMSLDHVRSVNTVSLKINFCLCLHWLKQLRSIKVHHSGVCVSVPHLEYWASVQFLEQHLELCKASGQFFERWLQRGKHSNPLWPFCYLENTKNVYNMCQDNSQLNTCLWKMHQSTTNPHHFSFIPKCANPFYPSTFCFLCLKVYPLPRCLVGFRSGEWGGKTKSFKIICLIVLCVYSSLTPSYIYKRWKMSPRWFAWTRFWWVDRLNTSFSGRLHPEEMWPAAQSKQHNQYH